ncbi:MAG: Glutamine synthetase [Phycisphaerae bacterium]|nr:Glutamine synthetase [Phycisphaerae bacterium]
MFSTAAEALKYIKTSDIAMVDLKVAGLRGQWLHLSVPARNFSQRHFEEGVGFDGSSGSGYTRIESGDVNARPDPTTAFIDPFCEQPTLSFICEVVTADTHEPFAGDPRTIVNRALEYMRSLGVADEAWMAPEFEFHIFDRVEVQNQPYRTGVTISCNEVANGGETPAIGNKGGYMRTPPTDQLQNVRTAMALALEKMGVLIRYHHHEVGAAGQCEIEILMSKLPTVADHTMLIKYVIKNVARQYGKLATFMPKPVFGEPGNGMHVHQKLQKGRKPVFYDQRGKNYANLSDTALSYIGGLLRHGRALTGLTNPSTNSFKRLVEGYEAPVNLFFSLGNRSAAIRIPRYAVSPQEKRIEYRPPDFTSNIYLTTAAMLMAGLDGVREKINPERENFGPFDVDIAQQNEAFKRRITALPHSLLEALQELEKDCEFLLRGQVFSREFIDHWISSKRRGEYDEVAHRPHPYEYQLYLDA